MPNKKKTNNNRKFVFTIPFGTYDYILLVSVGQTYEELDDNLLKNTCEVVSSLKPY